VRGFAFGNQDFIDVRRGVLRQHSGEQSVVLAVLDARRVTTDFPEHLRSD
jgi:hypothetical protein